MPKYRVIVPFVWGDELRLPGTAVELSESEAATLAGCVERFPEVLRVEPAAPPIEPPAAPPNKGGLRIARRRS
jgi:hypothetical protein